MKVIVSEGRCVPFKGETFLPGDEMDLPDKEAKRLLGKGAVYKPKPPAKKKAPSEKGNGVKEPTGTDDGGQKADGSGEKTGTES